MSKSWRGVFAFALSVLFSVWSFSIEARRGEAKKREGEYIIKLKSTPSIFSFDKMGFLGKKALRLSRRLSERDRLYLAKDDSLSAEATEAKIRELSKDPNVEYVEANYELHAFFGSRKPKPGPNPPFLPIPQPDPEPAPPTAPRF